MQLLNHITYMTMKLLIDEVGSNPQTYSLRYDNILTFISYYDKFQHCLYYFYCGFYWVHRLPWKLSNKE